MRVAAACFAAALVAAGTLSSGARGNSWNNAVRSYVFEPTAEDPDMSFQPELEHMPEGFAADIEGAMVTIGEFHGCAIEAVENAEAGGELVCWRNGRDKEGLLQVPDGIFVQVSAGRHHTCAIREDERLVCWGKEEWVKSPPAGAFVQVSSGTTHACAVRKDGALKCFGMCPLGACDAPAGEFVQVSMAGHAGCGVLVNGSAACWGHGSSGPTGFGGANLPRGVQFTQVSLSTSRTACGLTANSSMVCWGRITAHPDDGQLFVREGTFAMVSAGHNVYCGLRADLTLSCDGNVFHLGRNDPKAPAKNTQWTEVTTRHSTVCAIELDEPHTVHCWGDGIAKFMPEQPIYAAA